MGTFYRTGQKFVVNNYNSLLALPKQFIGMEVWVENKSGCPDDNGLGGGAKFERVLTSINPTTEIPEWKLVYEANRSVSRSFTDRKVIVNNTVEASHNIIDGKVFDVMVWDLTNKTYLKMDFTVLTSTKPHRVVLDSGGKDINGMVCSFSYNTATGVLDGIMLSEDIEIDDVPTPQSNSFVKSGGVYDLMYEFFKLPVYEKGNLAGKVNLKDMYQFMNETNFGGETIGATRTLQHFNKEADIPRATQEDFETQRLVYAVDTTKHFIASLHEDGKYYWKEMY